MGQYKQLQRIEKRLRSSNVYAEWVQRNRSPFCLKCAGTENLQCHHIVDVYHILLGLWKLYGNKDDVYSHALLMHSNDQCDSATLCDECHKKVHPARKINVKQANVHIASWAAIPRNLTVIAAHSTHDKRPEALSLIGYQTLLGLGWYILNGHLDTCIVEFNRRRLARLIGKNPDVSFNRSLERALKSLCHTGILQASHSKGNDIEVHLSRQYLELLIINPWFFPLHEVPTSRMCVLTLRLLLCMQGIKQTYRIGLKKLCGHLGILTTQPNKAQKAICSACEYIPWATISIKDGMCSFTLKKRKPVPIFSLRELITDAVRHGR